MKVKKNKHTFSLSDILTEALKKYCDEHNINYSTFVEDSLNRELKQKIPNFKTSTELEIEYLQKKLDN